MSKKPEEYLKKIVGKPVVVKLNSGLEYKGVLSSLDGYLNVAMEQAEEWQNGKKIKSYGDCFIRGNNGKIIKKFKKKKKKKFYLFHHKKV